MRMLLCPLTRELSVLLHVMPAEAHETIETDVIKERSKKNRITRKTFWSSLSSFVTISKSQNALHLFAICPGAWQWRGLVICIYLLSNLLTRNSASQAFCVVSLQVTL